MPKISLRRARRQEAPAQPAASPQTPTPDQPAASPQTPAPEQPAAGPQTPTQEYAQLGPDAPIAWPSGARRVPVTGKLSPHAAAALQRMGITQVKE
jgi:hypothetical protein